jgi:2-haloacid dehalogenase/putative hydrolase of the HAD superfamily
MTITNSGKRETERHEDTKKDGYKVEGENVREGWKRLRIDAVLFDGYGTLFTGGMDCLYEVCGDIASDHHLDLDGKALLKIWDGYFFPMVREGAFGTFRRINNVSLGRVFRQLGVDAPTEGYIDHLFDRLGRVSLYDDVRPALTRLTLPHGVVSNADSDHLEAALAKNKLTFELVVSSESARCYKPNPEIFDPALETLGLPAERVLYVGDSQEDDIVVAKRAGLIVAWLNRDGAERREGIPYPDFIIESLSELGAVLGSNHK